MTLRTEPVGSLPRPSHLQRALADFEAGRIDRAALTAAQDAACRDTIERMEATGSPIVSDGEQRASSFATYPLVDTLGGTGLADNLDPHGQDFAIFADGHHRRLPRLTRGPFRYRTYAGSLLARSAPMATMPMKQAVIAPSMLSLLYPLDEELPDYPRAQFHADLVDEAERDVRRCFVAGAAHVSIDFTEGRLALRDDPDNPWTGRGMLAAFIALNNDLLHRFEPEDRRRIGVHTCPGGDRDTTHSADVDYADLLPQLFELDAGYFLIQCASEPDRRRVYELIGRHRREDAEGVPQVCHIGVTNPQDPRVETAEEVRDAVLEALEFIPAERFGTTDDCGFSPFSSDDKPRHGSVDAARDVAFAKIEARVRGTRLAAERLGLI
jgi:methionine synthase II (cobalamin-independent)